LIISDSAEKLANPSRVVLYDAGEDGRCVPTVKNAEFNDEIDVYYEQRAKELVRLHGRLMAGDLSPVGFFVEYQRMDPKDVAARARVSASAVRRHMTPSGFDGVTAGQLRTYARIFDISVADFFCFTFVGPGLEVTSTRHHDRLIQQITFSQKTSGKGAARDDR